MFLQFSVPLISFDGYRPRTAFLFYFFNMHTSNPFYTFIVVHFFIVLLLRFTLFLFSVPFSEKLTVKMEYTIINGFNGGKLYYLHQEKHLFVKKTVKNGTIYLVCYDTIERSKDKKNDPNYVVCTARCHLIGGQIFRTRSDHKANEDHEIIFRDLISLNAMKDHCRYLAKHFPFSAHKIPVSEIFYVEMSK